MLRHGTVLALALALAPAAGLAAQEPGRIRLDRYKLDNGLTVILAEDHSAQVVAVDVWYDVGSRNEVRGRSGFAHLFEHMMFQGSAHVGKGEHFQLVERAGGDVNGSTTTDRTNYFEVLPSNRLNLGLWLEADRMRSLAVTDANFENQRETVKEERRQRLDNQPYAGAIIEGLPRAYDSTTCFPYSHSVIGSMDDLNAGKTADVKAFFDLYYAPNNATLVVAGDFDPAETKRFIQEYFGGIPRGQEPPPVTCDVPFRAGGKRLAVADKNANLPAVVHAYLTPPTAHADVPALQLLATILGQGESSRINRHIVREKKLAVGAQVALNLTGPTRGPGQFGVIGIANQGVSPDSLDRAMAAEVARIAAGDVTAEELEKARNRYRAQTIFGRQRALAVAEQVHFAHRFLGDAEQVNTDLDRYMAVTLDDLKRVAGEYLRPDNLLTIVVTPEAK